VCVNIHFVCFHSGAAVLRPIGEQYRVLCASVNSHIFFLSNITFIYFGFLYCYYNVLHQFITFSTVRYLSAFYRFFLNPFIVNHISDVDLPFDVSAFKRVAIVAYYIDHQKHRHHACTSKNLVCTKLSGST
jgi:hypothetical protein